MMICFDVLVNTIGMHKALETYQSLTADRGKNGSINDAAINQNGIFEQWILH